MPQKTTLILSTAAVVAAVFFEFGAAAQQPPDAEMVASIRGEELHHSMASALFYTLTDTFGSRLSGSPSYDKAAGWAVQRFSEWGLANPHLESFKFGPAWTLEKLTTEMTAPRYMPLLAYAEAWSPSTAGVVTGTPIYVGDSSVEEIDALGGRLRHAIVLTARPQTEYLSKDRQEASQGDGPVRTGNPLFPGPSSRVPQRELLARLQKYGAGVALVPSATLHGTVRVQGNPATTPDAVPTLTVAAEQYNMLVRLVKAGGPLELRIEVVSYSNRDRLDSDNVIAEIPGTDPSLKDEVVLVGAHLDSWHTATGATDNADAVSAAMEAMRILTALHARPRRTIRVALWGGEEQGMIGSRSWAAHISKIKPRATKSRFTSTTIRGRDRPTASTWRITLRRRRSSMDGLLPSPIWACGGT